MAKYVGGMNVKGGYYWNAGHWNVEVIPNEGGKLPKEGARYVKVPFPLVLLLVPLLGALFLVFLPFIGFAMFAYAIAKKLTGGAKEAAADLAATVSPGWAPGEAHLTGKKGEEKGEGGKAHPELEKLEKEIAEKRGEKKE